MAKIVVTKITSEGATSGGTKKWTCMGTIDGEPDVFVVWDKPEIAVEFEGQVKDDPKFGKSVSTGRGRGGGGGGGYRRDPEEGRSIARQNALAHSTEILVTIAKMTVEAASESTNKETGELVSLAEAKKAALEEAKKLLKPGNIITVAKHLYAFSKPVETGSTEQMSAPQAPAASGQVAVTNEALKAAFPESADQLANEKVDPAKHANDIDPNDIPF